VEFPGHRKVRLETLHEPNENNEEAARRTHIITGYDSTLGRSGGPGLATARGHPTVFSLMHRNRNCGLRIAPETTVPLWEGERMDDGMAVEGLL